MCIGIPMRILAVSGILARCEDGSGRLADIDLSLLPDARPGDWILTFLGGARRVLEEGEAELIHEALSAVAAAMDGSFDEDAFADLAGRSPTLPPHLEAARAAGRSEA